jgi:lipopolysaccharide biosynthesis glycosyltransferase
MNIAFCINSLGLIGLGVTISSLVRSCSDPGVLKIWFFCANLSRGQKRQISRLLESENFTGRYEFIDFEPKEHFGSFSSLHGDWTPYGRLLLADFINEDRVLYLDSDLVVEVDVLNVRQIELSGFILAAVGGGRFKHTLGHQFYIQRLGLDPDWEYFNSGVLLLNLELWRKNKIKEQCLELANQSPDLPSHDQSLLNMFCRGQFAKLPNSFNCEWLAHCRKPEISNKMILHFVGSPKPWDPLGYLLNNGYTTYIKYLNPEWNARFSRFSALTLNRAWNIRRSYLRCIYNKMKVTFGELAPQAE